MTAPGSSGWNKFCLCLFYPLYQWPCGVHGAMLVSRCSYLFSVPLVCTALGGQVFRVGAWLWQTDVVAVYESSYSEGECEDLVCLSMSGLL